MRTVMGLMGMAGGSLLGKLRLRLSTLVPGQLHTVDLPLQVWRCEPNPLLWTVVWACLGSCTPWACRCRRGI